MRYCIAVIHLVALTSLAGQNTSFLEEWHWGQSGSHYILNLNLIHSITDPDQTLFQQPYKGTIVALDANNLVAFIVDPIWNRIIYANYNDNWINAYGTYGSGDNQIKHPRDISATESASLVCEYDYMTGLGINNNSLSYSEVEMASDYILEAFEDVGLAARLFVDENDVLPVYEGPTNKFPSDDELLRRYAKDHDNGNYPWHLLCVDRFEENFPGAAITYGIAVTMNNGNHFPPSPAEERFSMVFVQDIIESFSDTGDEPDIAAALITTAVHELGHQRAGLTDASLYLQDHANQCLMYWTQPVTLKPRFCRTIDRPGDQETHCQQVFEDNYDNF